MNYITDHVGYLTGDISSTAKEFERLGYVAGDIVDDDTQRTKICFLTKPGEVRIELVQPYEDNKTMQKMLFKPVAAPAFDNRKICYFWNSEIGFIELVNREK